MKLTTSGVMLVKSIAAAVPQAVTVHRQHSSAFLRLLFSFGLFGLFLVSIVDSSFVPLPIPGVTDIMILLLAARNNWLFPVLVATAGSAIGGYFSYQVGQSGGMAFLEKRVPARIFKLISDWMENHAVLSVALPAILPPPMPLSPFVLAAGALKMSRRKFLTTFILSRALRHAFVAWLGVHYGRHVLHLWSRFSAKWATTILIVVWVAIAISCAIAFWKIYKTSRTLGTQSLATHPNTTV